MKPLSGSGFGAGAERFDIELPGNPPRSAAWVRFPFPVGDDPRLNACVLTYLSDTNPMTAVRLSHPRGANVPDTDESTFMSASLDHAMWFHRPVRSNEWFLIDMNGHGIIGSRGLATGLVFQADGTHVATIAQEGLLRERRQ